MYNKAPDKVLSCFWHRFGNVSLNTEVENPALARRESQLRQKSVFWILSEADPTQL